MASASLIWRWPTGEVLHTVTLVTKEGCTMCEKVLAVLRGSPSREGCELRIWAIGGDPDSETRYLLRIPVVLVDGVEVFEARQMDLRGLWREKLEGILAGLAGKP